VIHLLAAWTVDAFEKCRDKAFLDGELGLQRSDFRGEFLDLLLGRLNGFPSSKSHAMGWI
jgi:hypothetical protein